MRHRSNVVISGSRPPHPEDLIDDECLAPRCRLAPLPGAPLAICLDHAMEVRDLVGDVNAERIMNGRRYGLLPPAEPQPEPENRQGLVYYVRFADHIKIGFTRNLKQRMAAMHVHRDAVLAVELAERETESLRHQQFHAEREHRTELFLITPRLVEHVRRVRNEFGDPKNFLSDAASHLAG